MAVRKRNEGVSDQAFGQELAERFQNIMRGKLKFGAGASMPTIDRLAANEASLFHALGTEGAAFCLKMLGKDDTPATEAPPDSVRRLMQLGTLYRFQAIVEGMAANAKPVDPLTKEETRVFEASLAREGLNFKDVNTGAYLKASRRAGQALPDVGNAASRDCAAAGGHAPQDVRRDVLCRPGQVTGSDKMPNNRSGCPVSAG